MINEEIATLGGGCFWCVEAVLQRLKGVNKVYSGYANSKIKNPTYREVCSGLTGAVEVVQVHFNPEIISYKDLLTVFMTTHDPTTLNQQGADKGTQYRSAILYTTEAQKETAQIVLEELKDTFGNPIVTEVKPLQLYNQAEEYHQNYYNNNGQEGFCQMVINPKVAKLRKLHQDKLA